MIHVESGKHSGVGSVRTGTVGVVTGAGNAVGNHSLGVSCNFLVVVL